MSYSNRTLADLSQLARVAAASEDGEASRVKINEQLRMRLLPY